MDEPRSEKRLPTQVASGWQAFEKRTVSVREEVARGLQRGSSGHFVRLVCDGRSPNAKRRIDHNVEADVG